MGVHPAFSGLEAGLVFGTALALNAAVAGANGWAERARREAEAYRSDPLNALIADSKLTEATRAEANALRGRFIALKVMDAIDGRLTAPFHMTTLGAFIVTSALIIGDADAIAAFSPEGAGFSLALAAKLGGLIAITLLVPHLMRLICFGVNEVRRGIGLLHSAPVRVELDQQRRALEEERRTMLLRIAREGMPPDPPPQK